MKAAQLTKYSKTIGAEVVEIPVPAISANEVLVKVKAAALNPLELLVNRGSIKLMAPYKVPFTIGNELSGVIEQVGSNVTGFKVGDQVYSRLPIKKIGAFAEYAAIDQMALALMPTGMDFKTAAAIPLVSLTAYQGLVDILKVEPGKTLFIPGGSGSFGQLAIPLAVSMGLKVIVSGSAAVKESAEALGVTQYIDYKTENYWEVLKDIDYVIDTVGKKEFIHELSVMKPGGKLLSLIDGPNRDFGLTTKATNIPWWKLMLFTIAGAQFDREAKKKQITYHFIFVEENGEQLQKITQLVNEKQIKPRIDPHEFTIDDVNEALNLLATGHPGGKVVITF